MDAKEEEDFEVWKEQFIETIEEHSMLQAEEIPSIWDIKELYELNHKKESGEAVAWFQIQYFDNEGRY